MLIVTLLESDMSNEISETEKKPQTSERKTSRNEFRDFLREPSVRDVKARAFLPINVEIMSYQINSINKRLFGVLELYSYSIFHIGILGGQEQSKAGAEAALAAIAEFDQKISKELDRYNNMATEMGLTEKVIMRGSEETVIQSGSPIATKYAQAMIKVDELFELLNRLWLNGMINAISKDNGMRQYVRALKLLARNIINLSNRTYNGYQRAQRKAESDRQAKLKKAEQTSEKTNEVSAVTEPESELKAA